MNGNRKRKCQFCREKISKDNFQIVNEIINEILDLLLLKLNWDESGELIICDTCTNSLKESFDFKSMILYSEDVIFPFITSNNTIDLIDVYLQEHKDDKQINIDKYQQICRLCIKLITEEFSISLTELQRKDTAIRYVLQNHISELNLSATKEPMACRTCLGSLNMFSKFLMCLNGEKYNKINIETEDEATDRQMVVTYIKEENQEKSKGMFVSEDYELECSYELKHDSSKGFEISGEESSGKNSKEGNQKDFKIEVNTETWMDVEKYQSTIVKEEIDIKSEESESERIPETPSHLKKSKEKRKYGKTQGRIVKCKECPYSTYARSRLERHLLVHRKLSEVKLFKCDKCPFDTKYDYSLRKHLKRHLTKSEGTIYNCDLCDFKSISKESHRRHVRYHKNEIKIHKCEVCGYETIDKNNFTYHSMNHKSTSEVTMLKCYSCKYETRHRQQMVIHTRVHIDPSKITMLQCKLCNFQTKARDCLKNHMITHKDPSEIKMHQCDVCSYETRYRYTLKSHMLIHASPSEVTMYSCDICSYESRYKGSVTAHMRRHKKKQP